MKEKCDFCKELKWAKERDKRYNDDRFREKYYVKLFIESERDLYRTGNWDECGSLTYGKSPLNFCPECGRKIK